MFAYENTLRYIEENLQAEISIEDLAEHAGYSKHHFCHLFKETMGQPVGSFIKRLRLLYVLHALYHGASATDVIHNYGFDTYGGFYKAFVKMFGCSPKAYVETHKDELPLNVMEEQFMSQYTTDRCVLSHLCENDIPEAIRLLTEPQVREYLGGPILADVAVHRIKGWINAPDSIHYTVRNKETKALMGIIDISPHHNLVDKEISYQFLPEYWGEGYAYEVLNWLLAHCKNNLHVDNVVSETQSANTRSCDLLNRLGYEEKEQLIRFEAEQTIYTKHL